MKLILTDKKQETADVYTFLFKSEEPILYLPGQFLRYKQSFPTDKIDDPQPDSRGVNRFFSIAAAPHEGNIRITTRMLADKGSSFKKHLLGLNVGDSIEAMGPYGGFTLGDPNQENVFVAGGIGITPFRAMLLDLAFRKFPINVTLIYANRNSEIVFKNELEFLTKGNPNFKIHYFISGEQPKEVANSAQINTHFGKIDAEAFKLTVPDLQKPVFYISGPEPMVKAFEEVLAGLGVLKEKIKIDYFPGYTEI